MNTDRKANPGSIDGFCQCQLLGCAFIKKKKLDREHTRQDGHIDACKNLGVSMSSHAFNKEKVILHNILLIVYFSLLGKRQEIILILMKR